MLRRLRNTWRTRFGICGRREVVRALSRLAAIFVLAFLAVPAYAASTYESFSSDIDVQSDGTFLVTETIRGNFSQERHGIYRTIPVRYDAGYGTTQTIGLEVERVERDGQDEPYALQWSDARTNRVIRIGDPDTTFQGPFVYTIVYRVDRAMLFGETTDELYWNVSGTGWDEPLPVVDATIHLPGVSASQLSIDCYTGADGSTSRDCVSNTSDGMAYARAEDFLTVSVLFPTGIVTRPSGWTKAGWWLADNWKLLLAVIPLATLVWAVRHWRKYGRDPKGTGVLVVQYDAPDGLSATEMGTLVDARFEGRDFAAAIVDLAARGYVRVTEGESLDKDGYVLSRLRRETDGLRPYETTLLSELFGDGDEVGTAKQSAQFARACQRVKSLVYQELVTRGYFVSNPETVRSKYLIVAVLFLTVTVRWVSLWFVTIPTTAILLWLSQVMPKRTERGQAAYEHALGFREYVSKAEAYRVQWQEKEGIFETILPYAMAFGVATKWCAIYDEEHRGTSPNWYVGNAGRFPGTRFGDMIAAFGASVTHVSAPKGGSKGGSSGRGFGGGGGGSW